ncbi:MAG: hypothetical protein ACLUIS_11075 [Longibaculum sp.]
MVFGVFSVVAVKFVQPYLLEKIMQHGLITLVVIATMLTTIFIIDLIFTVVSLTHLDERLDEFMKDIESSMQKLIDDVEQSNTVLMNYWLWKEMISQVIVNGYMINLW